MIKIEKYPASSDLDFQETRRFNLEEQAILMSLIQEQAINRYPTAQPLNFEMKLRAAIMESAKQLNQSAVTYAVFEKSYCNKQYWDLQQDGGFKLKPQALPSEAIQDIYINGSQYAFECATAMVIVFYKAVLQSINEDDFNRLYADILLWDWQYDKDLGIVTQETDQFIPGDVLYFKNPQVDPANPEWQGENAVYLDTNRYYGHGIGIKSAEEMIAALNANRIPNATESAYLLNQATRPGFQYLSQFASDPAPLRHHSTPLSSYVVAHIGETLLIQA
jgi:protein-glutamine gamma-glutamyltransferase